MTPKRADILVAGGGLAGLSAAARLAVSGRRIIVVDPAPDGVGAESDLRTTAFLQPAVETLTRSGVWPAMAGGAAELRVMRIIDAGGRSRVERERADFQASELTDTPFGWNVTNIAAKRALLDKLGLLPSVSLMFGTSVTGCLARSTGAVVRLSTGERIEAALVVAADGRGSPMRTMAGIGVRRWAYGQTALVFAVGHPRPHDGVSTEFHSTGGPCTLVPLPDRETGPASAVVWMMPNRRADRLADLPDAALAAEITAETMGSFGPLQILGNRAAWPISSQVAHRLRAERLALLGEAAHAVPPIGAQGLNMSLADAECLAQLIESAGTSDIGADTLLARYEMRRMPEVLARIAGVDVLNRLAMAEAQPVRDLRRGGLAAISRITPIRRLAMRLGLGTAG